MTTEEILLGRFGSPLLTLSQLAAVLDRSPQGLRISMIGTNDLAIRLKSCRVKIGRRIFFKVSGIAQLIDGYESQS